MLHRAANSTCWVLDFHCNTHTRPRKDLIAVTQQVNSVRFPNPFFPFVQCFGHAAEMFLFHFWLCNVYEFSDAFVSFWAASCARDFCGSCGLCPRQSFLEKEQSKLHYDLKVVLSKNKHSSLAAECIYCQWHFFWDAERSCQVYSMEIYVAQANFVHASIHAA